MRRRLLAVIFSVAVLFSAGSVVHADAQTGSTPPSEQLCVRLKSMNVVLCPLAL